jgi:hypothetical protein
VTDHLASRPPEHPLGRRIRRQDRARLVDRQDRVDGGVEHGTRLCFTVTQSGQRHLAFACTGLSSALWTATNIALAAGDSAAALRYSSDELALVAAVARDPNLSADVGQALHQRGKSQQMLGNNAAAVTDLKNAITSLSSGFGEDHPETVEARNLLAEIL